MRRYLSYLKYLLRHKWYVFLACLDLGVPLWMAILHDWDKFLPSRFIPYARFFRNPDGSRTGARKPTGEYDPTDTGSIEFEFAWFLHQKVNRHHWQWWILPTETGGIKALSMPDVHRREMLADMRGAGRALGLPDTKAWYMANCDKMQLHPETRLWLEDQLGISRVTE